MTTEKKPAPTPDQGPFRAVLKPSGSNTGTPAKESRHDGRVTRRGSASESESLPSQSLTSQTPGGAPVHVGRVTRPAPGPRRPAWHRRLGWVVLAIGVAVLVLNYLMLLLPQTLLPGGHSEAYLILALVIGGFAAWLLGVFDPLDR